MSFICLAPCKKNVAKDEKSVNLLLDKEQEKNKKKSSGSPVKFIKQESYVSKFLSKKNIHFASFNTTSSGTIIPEVSKTNNVTEDIENSSKNNKEENLEDKNKKSSETIDLKVSATNLSDISSTKKAKNSTKPDNGEIKFSPKQSKKITSFRENNKNSSGSLDSKDSATNRSNISINKTIATDDKKNTRKRVDGKSKSSSRKHHKKRDNNNTNSTESLDSKVSATSRSNISSTKNTTTDDVQKANNLNTNSSKTSILSKIGNAIDDVKNSIKQTCSLSNLFSKQNNQVKVNNPTNNLSGIQLIQHSEVPAKGSNIATKNLKKSNRPDVALNKSSPKQIENESNITSHGTSVLSKIGSVIDDVKKTIKLKCSSSNLLSKQKDNNTTTNSSGNLVSENSASNRSDVSLKTIIGSGKNLQSNFTATNPNDIDGVSNLLIHRYNSKESSANSVTESAMANSAIETSNTIHEPNNNDAITIEINVFGQHLNGNFKTENKTLLKTMQLEINPTVKRPVTVQRSIDEQDATNKNSGSQNCRDGFCQTDQLPSMCNNDNCKGFGEAYVTPTTWSPWWKARYAQPNYYTMWNTCSAGCCPYNRITKIIYENPCFPPI